MRSILAAGTASLLLLTAAQAGPIDDCKSDTTEPQKRLEACATALKATPNDIDGVLGTGKAWLDLGNSAEALIAFEKAIAIAPKNKRGHSGRGLAQFGRGERPAAVADFTKALELDPAWLEIRLARAQVHVSAGQHGPALDDLGAMVKQDPSHAPAYELRAIVYSQLAKHDLALADASRLVELLPGQPGPLNIRGVIQIQKGGPAEGRADFEKALALAPADEQSRLNLIEALHRLEAYDEELAVATKGVETSATSARLRYALALAQEFKGLLDPAIATYQEVIRLEPSAQNAYLNLAQLHSKKGDMKTAIQVAGKLLEINPSHVLALVNRSSYHINGSGDLAAALADCTKAIEIDAASYLAHHNCASAQARRGYREQAIAGFRRVLEIEPAMELAREELRRLGVTP